MKKNITEKDVKEFGYVLAAIAAVIGMVHLFRAHFVCVYFFAAAFLVLCLTVFRAKTLKPVYFVFIRVALAIGWVNARIILFLLYYFVLVPIAFLMKLSGRDVLYRKYDGHAVSYWEKRSVCRAPKESLEKQY